LDRLLADLCAVVARTGALIEDVRRGGLNVERKADRSLVTRADREADALLRDELPALAPAAWLSEETADAPDRLAQRRLWVVDPIDGTREFVQGLPEYAVAAALVEDGQPLLAVVHNPATGDVLCAARGGGAWRNGARVRVSESRRLLGSRSESGQGEFAPFAAEWDVVPMGSIQLKLALVAAGEAGVTLSRGPKHEWDVCAGALIVAEAGGRVSDVFGAALRYNQPFPKVPGVLAGAPEAYERARAQVARLGASARMNELSRGRPG
jgi:myo-inositol-1(or 4)-monophosphatase